jgi:hypothetical protein
VAIFNTTTPCPYCYTEINPRRLACRCSGRQHPDQRPCAKAPDPVRQWHFADSDPYWPVISPIGTASAQCQSCGAASGPPVCPECHSLLPIEFTSTCLQIGVVGDYFAGKSTLLAALDREIQTTVATRFEASVQAGDTSGNRDLELEWSILDSGGHLPNQTARIGAGGRRSPAIYSWRSTRGRRANSSLISFCDYSGSDFAKGGSPDDIRALAYLASSTEILFLLDPFNFKVNAGRRLSRGLREPYPEDSQLLVLQNVVRLLREARGIKSTRRIDVPIACVVGKMDAFADQFPEDAVTGDRSASGGGGFDDAKAAHKSGQVRSLIAAWDADHMIHAVEKDFSTVRCFGVSALGSEPDYTVAKLAEPPARPSSVAEPLLWFMARRRLVPSTRSVRNVRNSQDLWIGVSRDVLIAS